MFLKVGGTIPICVSRLCNSNCLACSVDLRAAGDVGQRRCHAAGVVGSQQRRRIGDFSQPRQVPQRAARTSLTQDFIKADAGLCGPQLEGFLDPRRIRRSRRAHEADTHAGGSRLHCQLARRGQDRPADEKTVWPVCLSYCRSTRASGLLR